MILKIPNLGNFNSEDIEIESSSFIGGAKKVKIPIVKDISKSKEGQIKIQEDLLEITNDISNVPEFNFDFNKMKTVKFTSDLLFNLVLNINSKGLLNDRIDNFDETITYDKHKKLKFNNLVLNRKGYLEDESNYFRINENKLQEERNACSLRNSRVVLYWKGFMLDEISVKRILTLGLTFLIGSITYAELYYYIQEMVPKGTFEVSIKYKSNVYVLIGIEAPIFNH